MWYDEIAGKIDKGESLHGKIYNGARPGDHL